MSGITRGKKTKDKGNSFIGRTTKINDFNIKGLLNLLFHIFIIT